MNANLRNFGLWVIIVLLLLALFTLFQNPAQRTASQDISFSQLLNEVDQNRVRDVVIQGPEIRGTLTNGSTFVNGDAWGDLNLANLRFTYSRNYPSSNKGETVGKTYTISAIGALSGNYDLRYRPGTLTVVP